MENKDTVDNRSFGYARVSTSGGKQKTDRQVEQLKKFVSERDIIKEQKSGKDLDRPGLKYLIDRLMRNGDTLYVTSLDRLGRRKDDIKKILEVLKGKNITVRILDLPTTMVDRKDDPNGKAIMDLVNNLLIEVLGYVAEQERNMINKRREEGQAIAKARGKHMGRKYRWMPDTWDEDYKDWKAGKVTAVSLIKKYDWSPTTFYERVKLYEVGYEFKEDAIESQKQPKKKSSNNNRGEDDVLDIDFEIYSDE